MDQTIKSCKKCGQPIKDARGRCRRRTCVTQPRCWQHTQQVQGLRVKPSTVAGAGKGLFATKTFERNQTIAPYKGEKLTHAQLERRYPGDTVAQYVAQRGPDLFLDARRTSAGVARYANHKRPPQNNADLTAAPHNKVELEAKRRIRPGQEIFVDYGPEYWQQRRRPKRAKKT